MKQCAAWLLLLIPFAGCQDSSPKTKPVPVKSEQDVNSEKMRVRLRTKGTDRAKLEAEEWLEEAKTRGGKELRGVKSWRIMDASVVDSGQPITPGVSPEFKVRVLVDHADSDGVGVSIEYIFYFSNTIHTDGHVSQNFVKLRRG